MKLEMMIQTEEAKLSYLTKVIENEREFITAMIKRPDIDAESIRNSAIRIEKRQAEAQEVKQTLRILESLKDEQ